MHSLYKCDLHGPNPAGEFLCVTQFTVQSQGTGESAVCITNANAGTTMCDPSSADKSYGETCIGVDGENLMMAPTFAVQTRTGPLRAFDFANIAGFTFTQGSTPSIGLVAQFSWAADATVDTDAVNQIPGLYAVVTEDLYGLAGHWTTVTGGSTSPTPMSDCPTGNR